MDYLGAVLLAFGRLPDPDWRHFEKGALRVITRELTFASVLEQAFRPVLPYAAGNAEVLARILGTLERLGARITEPDRVRALTGMVRKVSAAADAGIHLAEDRNRTLQQAADVLRLWSGEGMNIA